MITIKLIKTFNYEIKKSKFYAYYYELDDSKEVSEILDNLKRQHKKATQFPYAYIIDGQVKKNEDKEPSNTAGMPILNVMQKNNLNRKLIVVVRYFGGTKLGAGGLLRSYNKCACEVIK